MSNSIEEQIERIRTYPARLEAVVRDLSEQDLTTPYLDGEWTVAQNVHHVADSHLNAYMRFKLFLLEENSVAKPYDQDVWATTADSMSPDMSATFILLNGIHARWVALMESLSDEEWTHTGGYTSGRVITLVQFLDVYAKHGDDHIDQIQRTLAAKPDA
ncbi:MAG: DinB family protein [Aggregatilineales bacterium]